MPADELDLSMKEVHRQVRGREAHLMQEERHEGRLCLAKAESSFLLPYRSIFDTAKRRKDHGKMGCW